MDQSRMQMPASIGSNYLSNQLLECFESHRVPLPPGTRYEGSEKLFENRLKLRIMNGVDVVTLGCVLNPDGTLLSAGK